MMDKAKPILKTFIWALLDLLIISALVICPLLTCSKTTNAAGTDSYLLLEYLESDGSQYIDTGYKPDANTKWVVNCMWTTSVTQSSMMGVIENVSGTNQRMDVALNNSGSAFVNVGTGNPGVSYSNAVGNVLTYIIDNKNSFASVNSSVNSSWNVIPNLSLSIYIFARHNSSGASLFTSTRLYSSQIYNNGVLARDFVPAKRSSDGVLGLLDRVNGVFYTNQGTGTFTAGYLANDYYVCSYIQSSGTQYIDTGFVGSSMGTAIVTAEVVAAGDSNTFIGGSFAGGTTRFYLWRLTSAGVSQFVGWGSDVNLSNGSSINNKTTGAIDGLTLKANLNDTFINLTSVSFDASLSFYLFKLHRVTNQDADNSIAKIYSATLFENGVLKRNMIPVYDPVNNIAGMWDNVNGVWYGNVGTGSFLYICSAFL